MLSWADQAEMDEEEEAAAEAAAAEAARAAMEAAMRRRAELLAGNELRRRGPDPEQQGEGDDGQAEYFEPGS